jgi:hypothetical protein
VKLEQIASGASLEGVEPSSIVTVVAAIPILPDSLQLIYKLPDGTLRERLLSRADEAALQVATTERPWSFDGNGAAFQLAAEAKRIDLAFLFDTLCDRRGLAEDARAYNELVTSWPAIESAAGEVPERNEQLDLFGGET